MISRRGLFLGLTALTAAIIPQTASANSILNLFAPPPPVIIRTSRRLPGSVSEGRRISKKNALRSGKKSKIKTSKVRKPFTVDPRFEPQEVSYSSGYQPGTIVVDSSQRYLYLITGASSARRYGVAIGKEGLGWKGTATIKAKAEWPGWTPTAEMIKRSPEKYARYKDGMPGGPSNPLGARALYFYQGKRDIAIRIHGTTQPWTIGKAASNGCFRMVNEHVIDLYNRVPTGTKVVVL